MTGKKTQPYACTREIIFFFLLIRFDCVHLLNKKKNVCVREMLLTWLSFIRLWRLLFPSIISQKLIKKKKEVNSGTTSALCLSGNFPRRIFFSWNAQKRVNIFRKSCFRFLLGDSESLLDSNCCCFKIYYKILAKFLLFCGKTSSCILELYYTISGHLICGTLANEILVSKLVRIFLY